MMTHARGHYSSQSTFASIIQWAHPGCVYLLTSCWSALDEQFQSLPPRSELISLDNYATTTSPEQSAVKKVFKIKVKILKSYLKVLLINLIRTIGIYHQTFHVLDKNSLSDLWLSLKYQTTLRFWNSIFDSTDYTSVLYSFCCQCFLPRSMPWLPTSALVMLN